MRGSSNNAAMHCTASFDSKQRLPELTVVICMEERRQMAVLTSLGWIGLDAACGTIQRYIAADI